MELVFVLDCPDPDSLADFWTAALGYKRSDLHGPYVTLTDPDGRRPDVLLQRVPEPKSGKNRMHPDLRVADMDAEVARVTGLGARVVRGPFMDDGWFTTVLADPQGNEFCLIVPPEEE
ncbi:VOC family protein [Actinomadura algeriensis]|uniref:Enzyme related to lactoylglutathione lyase n=1 Tax=Actinomadura algeriensis TaxID=1679523 RepID=A0ABR9K5M6_9ACTN|nr:VOC family protein [Actinomadura algeriensis]MBE1538003.1 putative enzyme related to lactoylglutathione lyase [Actinomadura algeriensis]